jgi:methyltransferase (TIGR00027 family)
MDWKMHNAPSLTARTVALLRAAHQLIEGGAIFPDPLAISIACEDVEAISGFVREHPEFDRLRLFTAARSRFADDCIESAVKRGVRQAVVLGAGLDTFGLRNPHAGEELRVFEVDRAATQQWKLECLVKANLQIPSWLSLVTADFEQQAFVERLKAAGFNDDQPAFFTWLGVVPYLSRDTVFATLSSIARLPNAEVVFDYGKPVDAYPPARRAGYEAMIAGAAAVGEPWLSFFVPDELETALAAMGFDEIEDLSPRDIAIRYFGEQNPPQNAPGAHFVRAHRSRTS